jgi:hypothetical protein
MAATGAGVRIGGGRSIQHHLCSARDYGFTRTGLTGVRDERIFHSPSDRHRPVALADRALAVGGSSTWTFVNYAAPGWLKCISGARRRTRQKAILAGMRE